MKERLIHVHGYLADDWRTLYRLLQVDTDLHRLYQFTPEILSQKLAIPLKKALQLFTYLQTTSVQYLQEQCERNHAFCITILDEDYPSLLREIPDPPFVLYGKGNRRLLTHPQKIAVVGTRKPSSYGLYSIQSILSNLLQDDILIVSGLAYGIDIEAHLLALRQRRATIAVLGGGFEHVYPRENEEKLRNVENVLLLSEYPPSWRPKKWYFPKRNRIISGLSRGLLVVEAKLRSGTLITADCALEQNRDVFAIPGPIHLETSKGTNRLIQQGAKLVTEAADIVEELKIMTEYGQFSFFMKE